MQDCIQETKDDLKLIIANNEHKNTVDLISSFQKIKDTISEEIQKYQKEQKIWNIFQNAKDSNIIKNFIFNPKNLDKITEIQKKIPTQPTEDFTNMVKDIENLFEFSYLYNFIGIYSSSNFPTPLQKIFFVWITQNPELKDLIFVNKLMRS